MSDAAIANLVTGVVTVATLLVGFFTLWVKLRYNATNIEGKVDANTAMTARIERQTNGPLTERLNQLEDHAMRIQALEGKIGAVEVKIEGLGKNVDSTRHEIRGHFQTVMNQLNIGSVLRKVQPPEGGAG